MQRNQWIDKERWKLVPLWQKILAFAILFIMALVGHDRQLGPWFLSATLLAFGLAYAVFHFKTAAEQRRRNRAMMQATFLEPDGDRNRIVQAHGAAGPPASNVTEG